MEELSNTINQLIEKRKFNKLKFMYAYVNNMDMLNDDQKDKLKEMINNALLEE